MPLEIVQGKYHFALKDPSSSLYLDQCVFECGSHGFGMNHGTVYVDAKTEIVVSNIEGAGFDLGSAVDFNIISGASLEVDGLITYKETSYGDQE